MCETGSTSEYWKTAKLMSPDQVLKLVSVEVFLLVILLFSKKEMLSVLTRNYCKNLVLLSINYLIKAIIIMYNRQLIIFSYTHHVKAS